VTPDEPISAPLDVVVIGRVGADFPPHQIATPLAAVTGFDRTVGGFGGNVSTGLARLGVRVSLVAAVGDDGHGAFIRRFLEDEGVEISSLRTVPDRRTALAFFEVWPPETFPVTFYPSPTYWSMRIRDLPVAEIRRCRALVVSATALAHDPSRSATKRALRERAQGAAARLDSMLPGRVLDLDARAALWSDPADYRREVGSVVDRFDVVVGGAEEFDAAGLDPARVAMTAREVVVKRGAAGVTVMSGAREWQIPGLPVDTLCGLGAGDAFIGAYVAARLSGVKPDAAAARGNAAGAIVATRLGCSAAMPTPDEIDLLLVSHARPG
jgi:5-dehydro-2-deoxygluconokinase